MANKIALLIEGERRGLLNEHQEALLQEARRRGLAPVEFDPNEDLNFGEKALIGIGRSADKVVQGLRQTGLNYAASPKDSTLGKFVGLIPGGDAINEESSKLFSKIFPGAQAEADEVRSRNQENSELYDDNATGVMKGAEIAGDIAQYAIPSAAGAKFFQGLPLAARVLGQGATAAGIDAFQQTGEGAEEIDLGRTALTAGLGGSAEVLAPIVGRLTAPLIRKARSVFASTDDALSAGRVIAKEIPGAENLNEDQLRALGQYASQIDNGATPKAALSESEFGFRLTKGQRTGNPDILREEEFLRNKLGQGTENPLQNAADFNFGKIHQNIRSLAKQFSGNRKQLETPADAVAPVIKAIQGEAKTLNEKVSNAFKALDGRELKIPGASVKGLQDNIADVLSKRTVDPELTPATIAAIKDVKRLLKQAPKGPEILGPTGKPFRTPAQYDDVGFKELDDIRRLINEKFGAVKNDTDNGSLRIVKEQYSKFLDDVIDKGIASGDQELIAGLKKAVGLRRQYGQRYESGAGKDNAKKLIEGIIESGDDAVPEEIANVITGAADVSKVSSINFVRALKDALGDSPEKAAMLNNVKSAIILKIGGKIEQGGAEGVVSNLKNLFRNRPTLMKELFDPEERAVLQRFTQALDPLISKFRSSGTTERQHAFKQFTALLRRIPYGRDIVEEIQSSRVEPLAKAALKPLRGRPPDIGFPGAVASFSD